MVEPSDALDPAHDPLPPEDALVVDSGSEKKAQVPADLAEEWFELQDAILEAPSETEDRLQQFEAGLKKRSVVLREKISAFEGEYDGEKDADARRAILRTIEKLALDGQYLKSMERDLLKLKTRLGL